MEFVVISKSSSWPWNGNFCFGQYFVATLPGSAVSANPASPRTENRKTSLGLGEILRTPKKQLWRGKIRRASCTQIWQITVSSILVLPSIIYISDFLFHPAIQYDIIFRHRQPWKTHRTLAAGLTRTPPPPAGWRSPRCKTPTPPTRSSFRTRSFS